ncbi:hypothetical protein D3C74_472470 [compost metagenome]
MSRSFHPQCSCPQFLLQLPLQGTFQLSAAGCEDILQVTGILTQQGRMEGFLEEPSQRKANPLPDMI